MTDNEKWQRKPDEGENAARRDGDRKDEGFSPWKRNSGEGSGAQGSFDRPRKSNTEGRSGSGREGNTFDSPRRSFGSDTERPRRSFGSDTERPKRSFGDNAERPRRSFGDNTERPRRSFGEDNERPRRSFGDDGNRFDGTTGESNSFERPRRSFNNTDQARPRRPFSDDGNRFGGSSGGSSEGGFDRPRRFNNDQQGSDRPRRSFGSDTDRPKRSFGEDNDRPRRSFGSDSDRPKRTFGEGGFDRSSRPAGDGNRFGGSGNRFGESGNRFGGSGNRSSESGNRFGDSGNRFGGSDNRPSRTFGEQSQKPHFNGPSLPKPDRADGRQRRPRIQRESTFDHGVPYGRTSGPQAALDPTIPIRLNKFLANAGICSRREADEFIQAGVVKVNGDTVSELGVKVLPTDTILFHDQPVNIERKVYILLNKPKDCVTTSDDPQERMTVMDLVKGACFERIYPVGRLDRNTTGVLLLTNDGDLASKLTHPKFEKRKIYQVTLDRNLTEADFQSILEGVTLDEELVAVDNLSYVDPDKMNVVGIEIHSGQNRVVRRVFETFGYKVFKLDRVYFAGLTKKNLPRGKWRHLSEKEVNLLKMGAFV